MSDVILRVESLHKYFGDHHVLRGIDLEVRRGETVCMIGSSGSGKSTFLRCINFMEYPSAGRITNQGKVIGRESGSRDGAPASEQLIEPSTLLNHLYQCNQCGETGDWQQICFRCNHTYSYTHRTTLF